MWSWWAAWAIALAAAPQAADHGLYVEEPIPTWDEALPLGNGILGALVWGDGRPLKISLDRTDLWDLRPVPEFHSSDYDYETMQQWEAEGRYDELKTLYEEPYHRPGPTKIPAGRIELTFADSAEYGHADLNIATAVANVAFQPNARVETWIDATDAVGFVAVGGAVEWDWQLVAPAFGGKVKRDSQPGIVAGELAELGYPPPDVTAGPNWKAYEQEGWGGFRFAVYAATHPGRSRHETILAWTVATSEEGDNPLAVAKARVEDALQYGYNASLEEHKEWWNAYWRKGWVEIPNETIEGQWYLDMYKFGAASRKGHPPITLQGPWTADDGKLPPWKGDYHHDLNTELSYWPAYAGNRLEEGEAFLDWLWATRGNCREWTERFFSVPGMNVPMTADLNNNQIGGWRQYTHSATIAAWLAHHFYLHWRYSGDEAFLRDRAYPYLKEAATFIEAITEGRDADGKRTIPLSSSPEINDNKPDAWFPSITNYDLALCRWLLGATAEMADALGHPDDASHWRAVRDEFPELAMDEDGVLLVAEGHPLETSHRHLSHIMALHPLGLIDWSQGEEAQRTIRANIAHLEELGTDWWTGYSFAWFANLAARAKMGEKAARYLEIFADAFTLPNSFHCNGDQSGEGYSKFTYRPFTLEGNFAAAAAVHEMMIQSHSGVIEVFPAIPEGWANVAFHSLRAEGALLVSAVMEKGEVTTISVKAEKGGAFRYRSPWDGAVRTRNIDAGERVAIGVSEEQD